MEEKAYLLAFSHSGLLPKALRDLVAYFGTAAKAWEAGPQDFPEALLPVLKGRFLTFRKKFPLAEAWEKYRRSNPKMKMISLWEAGYPKALKEIHDPPPVLFYEGAALPRDEPSLAVVGPRQAGSYAKARARQWGRRLAEYGLTVVSGLARGVDAAAHWGALEGEGKTAAVLGSGLDRIYPPENADLARRIALSGSLVSEFPPGTPPYAGNFPRRNRIISGLSLGVLVIEAGKKSGALITAKFAVDEGREVFVLEGPSGGEFAEGSQTLVRDGAKPVQELGDVLEEFPYLSFSRKRPLPGANEKIEAEILESLKARKEGKVVEVLARETQLPLEVVTGTLLVLEAKGLVLRLPGNLYAGT